MAHDHQRHFLLATVLLILGLVVHDVNTATLDNELEISIQDKSTFKTAPNPSKLENFVIISAATDEPPSSSTTVSPTSTAAPPTTVTTPAPTTAPPTTVTTLAPTTAPPTKSTTNPITPEPSSTTTQSSSDVTTATTAAGSSTTTKNPSDTTTGATGTGSSMTSQQPSDVTTTTQAATTTEKNLPVDEIWDGIQTELKTINKTLANLKKIVDAAPTTTTAKPPTSSPGTATTEVPGPTTTPKLTTASTSTDEVTTPTTTPKVTTASTSTSDVTTPTTTPKVATASSSTDKVNTLSTNTKAAPKQRNLPLYFLRKVMLGKFKVEEETEICRPDEDSLCDRLKKVLKNIEDFSKKIQEVEEENVSMGDLSSIRGSSTELTDVSNKIEKDPSFVPDYMNVAAFDSRVADVTKGLEDAVTAIDDKLATDNTLAIVLGTLGGILGVALIVGGIVMYRKKKNKRKGRSLEINMEQKVQPSSTRSSSSEES